jgi:H+/gluconate symporter-like permease
MDTNGYRIIGVILIIISAISLLVGNLIEELWPVTQKIFESSIIIFIGLLGIIFLGVSKKKKIN